MEIRIALAGNPNCGKTTLFNALTGSNQYVGNWPGVTVEKKEGKLKGRNDIILTDLPGIYSLSPYSPEELVARNYLVEEKPDAILNIIDGTNLERNLYLTTQLIELGIPVVAAINKIDAVNKNGDRIDAQRLAGKLGCKVCEISALKSTGITEAIEKAVRAALDKAITVPQPYFGSAVEYAIDHIEKTALHDIPEAQKRWYAVKFFERDKKVLDTIHISQNVRNNIENDIKAAEITMDDDAEAIITSGRYDYISSIIKDCLTKSNKGSSTTSDKIDRIVTNRWLGLPIFALIMFLVYYISMVTAGNAASSWTKNGLFGEGWYLLGKGRAAYNEAFNKYSAASAAINAFGMYVDPNEKNFSEYTAVKALRSFKPASETVVITIKDEENLSEYKVTVYYDEVPENANGNINSMSYTDAVRYFQKNGFDEPDPAAYGIWIPGIPVLIEKGLDKVNCAYWLKSLILNGVIAGVGGVLGFVPQLLILFFMLAFLESCGYMSRVAFVLDRIFRKFGLSGKSFIPILIGTGCGVPGIMASRTIENESSRRMTVITTTFIPCSAKVPFIALISGAVFGGSPWISTGAYLIGIAAIIISGIMLKKTRPFAGDPTPFIMELPAYHLPTLKSVFSSMWERGWSFVKKAVTVILLSSVIVWFASCFGIVGGKFQLLAADQMEYSILAKIGNAICWIFAPLGWGNWQATVASLTGIIAKENIVGTLGVLYGSSASACSAIAEAFTPISALSFLIFNLLCAPCVAAITAINREMNSAKWFWFAIGYECCFAYVISLIVNNLGNLLTGNVDGVLGIIGVISAFLLIAVMIYMIAKPSKSSNKIRSVK